MKTDWDYTELADAYLQRPDYAPSAIDKLFKITELEKGASVCDVGAGVGHLTIELAKRGCIVSAIEPNDAMRKHGYSRTQDFSLVTWTEATGENTRQPENTFDLVTFGSSFNVVDAEQALLETKRILKSNGWFACMWNHRDLKDPLQKEVEDIIKSYIPDYSYGSRRSDQREVIDNSKLFNPCQLIEGSVTHTQSVSDWVNAWRSHGTLHRQAKGSFDMIVSEIEKICISKQRKEIRIPYITRMWIAQLRG